ncbi:MAG: 3'-5' exonuclease [Candidatus Thorarchaeota archaeon]
MLDVSLYLSSKQKFINGKSLPTIGHEVALEAAALSLSGIVISGLMEGGEASLEITNRFISTLCDYIRGRKGDTIATQSDIKLSNSLNNYLKTGKIRGRNQISLLNEIKKISEDCSKVEFTGESIQDWILIRSFLSNSNNEIIKRIGTDAKYLRLLNRGSILRSGLDELWREKGSYVGAKNLVRNALLQEHFSSSTRTWTGIHIMTMHKAKGKEFNEVIIYEGFYGGKILRKEATQKEKDQSRLNLRVAVTRAMEKTTILTPDKDICPFL